MGGAKRKNLLDEDIAALRTRWQSQGSFRRFFRLARTRLASFLQSRYSFEEEEIRLFLWTLRTVVDLVSDQGRPDQDDLIRLRMDANLSVYLIRVRYGAYLDFDRIMKVEHFLQPEFTQCYTVDEILANQ